MAKLTVKDLRSAIEGLDDSLTLEFQGNVQGETEEDEDEEDEPGYTTCIGYVYSVFQRDSELVIDCAITQSDI